MIAPTKKLTLSAGIRPYRYLEPSTYTYILSIKIGFGRELKESNFDWLVNYHYYRTLVNIESGATKFDADYFGDSLSFNLGYKF